MWTICAKQPINMCKSRNVINSMWWCGTWGLCVKVWSLVTTLRNKLFRSLVVWASKGPHLLPDGSCQDPSPPCPFPSVSLWPFHFVFPWSCFMGPRLFPCSPGHRVAEWAERALTPLPLWVLFDNFVGHFEFLFFSPLILRSCYFYVAPCFWIWLSLCAPSLVIISTVFPVSPVWH